MAKMTKLIAQVDENGGAFVGLLDDGCIRIGYRGMGCTDTAHPAARRLAAKAAGLLSGDLEAAVEDALRIVEAGRPAGSLLS